MFKKLQAENEALRSSRGGGGGGGGGIGRGGLSPHLSGDGQQTVRYWAMDTVMCRGSRQFNTYNIFNTPCGRGKSVEARWYSCTSCVWHLNCMRLPDIRKLLGLYTGRPALRGCCRVSLSHSSIVTAPCSGCRYCWFTGISTQITASVA